MNERTNECMNNREMKEGGKEGTNERWNERWNERVNECMKLVERYQIVRSVMIYGRFNFLTMPQQTMNCRENLPGS